MEFTLLWAALTAFVFAWAGTRIWSERLVDRPTDRLIGAASVGLLLGRLTAMILQGTNPFSHPGDILIVRGGVHTGAASIGAITTYLWAANWRFAALDATAPAALAGMAGWHAGCLWRSACLGTASNLPWAWAQQGSAVTRHPVELYAAVGFIAGAWLTSRLGWKILTRTGAGLALAGLIRLVSEPMRPSLTGGPIAWYLGAVVVGLATIWFGSRLGIERANNST